MGAVVRLTRLTIALAAAAAIAWGLFMVSLSVAGPSGAFCFDPDGTRPPDAGCVHVTVDPITGRGISNHETSRTDASGVTTWYHYHTAVTGPIAAPLFVTVPILTAVIYLVLEAVERRASSAVPAPDPRPDPGRP